MNIKNTALGTLTVLAATACILVTLRTGVFADVEQARTAPSGTHSSTEGMLTGSAYPLDYCIVTGEKLGSMGPAVLFNYEGREIRFCCKGCVDPFKKDAQKFIAELDAAIIEQQKDDYAADKCPISEEALDSMGGPEWIVVGNTLIGLCCGGCTADVRAEPQKYIDWINSITVADQEEDYEDDTCPVSGEELGDGAVDYVFAGELIRFCCKDCILKFEADPQEYLGEEDEEDEAVEDGDSSGGEGEGGEKNEHAGHGH